MDHVAQEQALERPLVELREASAAVASLYRYPVKGLSPQPEASLDLVAGEGLPLDRRFALALGSTIFDPAAPEPLDKGHFLMLRRDDKLAALRTDLDGRTGHLTIVDPGGPTITADIETSEGRATIEDFFLDYIGDACNGRPALVSAEGHKFTDVSVISPAMMRAVSLINLASVEDLAMRCGQPLHPLRFRANIYIRGLAPWEELDWVGREVMVGAAACRGVRRTKRCAAVDVDPETGLRDTNLTKALVSHYGHPDCGIYLEVLEGGTVRLDDAVICR